MQTGRLNGEMVVPESIFCVLFVFVRASIVQRGSDAPTTSTIFVSHDGKFAHIVPTPVDGAGRHAHVYRTACMYRRQLCTAAYVYRKGQPGTVK